MYLSNQNPAGNGRHVCWDFKENLINKGFIPGTGNGGKCLVTSPGLKGPAEGAGLLVSDESWNGVFHKRGASTSKGLPQKRGLAQKGSLHDKRVPTEGAFPQEGNSHRKGLPHRRELPWDGGLHRREIHIVEGCTGRTPTVSQGYSHAATDLRFYPKGRRGRKEPNFSVL